MLEAGQLPSQQFRPPYVRPVATDVLNIGRARHISRRNRQPDRTFGAPEHGQDGENFMQACDEPADSLAARDKAASRYLTAANCLAAAALVIAVSATWVWLFAGIGA
jgi:hypothetical protein